MLRWKQIKPYFLMFPITSVLIAFLVIPIGTILVVSFWDFNGFAMTPSFTLRHYLGIFQSDIYLATYLSTIRYVLITWLATLFLGYCVAYYLAFDVTTFKGRLPLLLLSVVPFLTSNVIRTIAWLPLLGREGLLNFILLQLRFISEPIEIFLYSSFSVVLVMVYLYTPLMVISILNSLLRIDSDLIVAAKDSGASGTQILREVILPLSAPGVAIGSILVLTLSMGEYFTIRVLGGGKAASVGYLIMNQLGNLQYPPASANAVLLVVITLVVISSVLRLVDVRRSL